MWTREMMKALEADGEKLRQLTGEDHGPVFIGIDPAALDSEYSAFICQCGRPHYFTELKDRPSKCDVCGCTFTFES
jgi:hypothetical protein